LALQLQELIQHDELLQELRIISQSSRHYWTPSHDSTSHMACSAIEKPRCRRRAWYCGANQVRTLKTPRSSTPLGDAILPQAKRPLIKDELGRALGEGPSMAPAATYKPCGPFFSSRNNSLITSIPSGSVIHVKHNEALHLYSPRLDHHLGLGSRSRPITYSLCWLRATWRPLV
jgi:hypothetical protein